MRRFFLAGLLLLSGGLGCASNDPVLHSSVIAQHRDRPPRHYEVYRPAPEPVRLPSATPRPTARLLTGTWNPRSRRISSRWTTIVIHHSATPRGSAKTFDKYHRQKGWDGLGYHFVIGNGTETRDGVIEVGPRWNLQKHGAHCKTPDNYYNDHGIGICLVGDFTKSGPTRKQLDSLDRLVRFLCLRCRIPAGRVVTHHSINRKTVCPGRNFAIARVRRTVGSRAAAGAR